MKSFLKQINESFESLQEKDWDGDGKQETPEQEYMGVKDRAIQQAIKKEAKGKYDDGDGKDEKCDYVPCNEEDLNNPNVKKIKCPECKGKGCDHCNKTGYHKEENKVDEMSTTASMGAPPRRPDIFKEKNEYKKVQEAMDRKYEQLIEGYREFALSDSKKSPAKKVNASIRHVAKQLKEIEKIVEYTGRLKTESGIAHSGFSSGTHNALRKISERLIKISERVRSLGE